MGVWCYRDTLGQTQPNFANKQRERERERDVGVKPLHHSPGERKRCVRVYTCIYIYIYTYVRVHKKDIYIDAHVDVHSGYYGSVIQSKSLWV